MAIIPMRESARIPAIVRSVYRTPPTAAPARAGQPRAPLRVVPVSPTWKENQPMTTVASSPAGRLRPRLPKVSAVSRAKFFPVLPAWWLSAPT